MARKARLTQTVGPTKVTPTVRRLVAGEAERREVAIADVIRMALDARYGLRDGEVDDPEPVPDAPDVLERAGA